MRGIRRKTVQGRGAFRLPYYDIIVHDELGFSNYYVIIICVPIVQIVDVRMKTTL